MSAISWLTALTPNITSDLISAAIGGLIVFIARDHVMRLAVKWWRKHAGTGLPAEVHEKIDTMHNIVEELRAHLGNGYLDDVHAKLDGLEQKFKDVVAEDIVPLLIPSQEE